MEFRKKVRSMLGQLDMDQKSLAMRAGISQSSLSGYLKEDPAERVVPPVDVALRIARALGVALDWLVDDAQGFAPTGGPDAAVQRVHGDGVPARVGLGDVHVPKAPADGRDVTHEVKVPPGPRRKGAG